ncbi:MAG: hypothetical protein OXI88_13030, partial [Gammaproteobacteria bacterium]|nr:hypothetical protein [Gammaproteobacteria bacterium]
MGLQRRRAIGVQGQLTGAQRLDALAQNGPVLAGDVEVATEIEQRALTHFPADALGAHQTVGVIGLAGGGGAGFGAADEHTDEGYQGYRGGSIQI